MANHWGVVVDDTVIHQQVQRAGERAEQQAEVRRAAQTAGERGLLAEKFAVAYAVELVEFGRQVQAEARRRGLGAAPQVFVVADGGV
ncbi:MAG TPA: hypothetical protein VMV89_04350 [Candidatus Paceibacterota bacterium]|nr:hypothetical protein [Candidatus Paceibacterota bacterium]